MKLSNLIALLTNRTVAGNAYVKDGELYQGNTSQAILVKNQAELNEVKKHVAPGSIAYTAGCASMWQLSAAGSWEAIQEEGGGGGMKLLTLTMTETSATLNATYAEVKAAMQAGTLVGFYMPNDGATSLVLAVAYMDASDPTHGDPFALYFKNLDSGLDIPAGADTEDGQLYLPMGG